MDQEKINQLKYRAKSAFGITQIQLNRKAKKSLSTLEESSKKINSMKNKEKRRRRKKTYRRRI